MREITQRELRNESGEIMRKVDAGESFTVTRNGVPLAELTPLRRHRFVPAETAIATFRGAPPLDYERFRADLDAPRNRARRRVPEARRARGILDTSVVIDLHVLDPSLLPVEVAVSSITMAELAAGPHATIDAGERARRQGRLQRAEAAFDPLPFDIDAARAYGRVLAAVSSAGRKARGARAVDLLIAATALAAGLPLFTRKADDFRALGRLLDVIEV